MRTRTFLAVVSRTDIPVRLLGLAVVSRTDIPVRLLGLAVVSRTDIPVRLPVQGRTGMSVLHALLALLFASAPYAHAQPDWNVLPADSAPRKMLSKYLLAEAQKHFDARRAEVAALKTPDDVKKRQALLKARMIEALGGFPAKTPLNATIV